ncbi:hypothetical protein G7077_08750 [Sphingomonas piscis]|uniref:Uncharacterized protein n=1 Tax=Sphingomonas piscis TaxID=2714943 RepID=A0A6G7YQF4_9SPHN|nr:hypothetical protein [Sphingomonas piscis]QIK78971.1 hypothetical protein G7077_08750 [Sphingomonas piscis]
MRTILLILIVGVLALIGAVATGFVSLNQTKPAQAPTVAATGDGVTAKGGQAPAFDVQTGSVKVGVEEKQVKVPTLKVEPAEPAQPAVNAQ